MNNIKAFLSILVVFLCVLAYNPISAQNLPQNINLDALSDQQLLQYITQAKASGLSDEQILQKAQSSNMSAAQIQRLQLRIGEIRKKQSTTENFSDKSSLRQLSNSDTIQVRQQAQMDLNKNSDPKLFGSELFRNSTGNTFEPNLKIATPINYVVGPDDHLHISINGKSLANWDLAVSPEGNINLPGIGMLKVAGRTIEQATQSIKSKLAANNYAVDKGTNVTVTLGDIRSIKVIIQGEVVRPGTYTLSSLASAFVGLSAAGGPNDIGSFRKIQVIRNSRLVSTLDLYDFLLKGSRKSDIALQDQDIILVPSYNIHVTLKGEVKIPAIFETLPGETLQDLINYSGGFTDQAYTARIKVIRVNDREREVADILESDYKNTIPLRGDKYTVDKILERYVNRISIKGAVFRPGDFELQKGLTISQLIKNAGGLKEDAFTARGSIVRLKPDNTIEQISFNVADAISNKPEADYILQREDIITISSIFDLRDQYKVTIKGDVRRPGEFSYADSMKVADLIIRAGGFAEGASTERVEVSRRIFNGDPHTSNSSVAQVYSINVSADLKGGDVGFVLKPFDIVSIFSLPGYETQKTVRVEGEVIYPGEYTIQKKNEKISDILIRAGGLTASADVDGSSLKRDNAAVLGIDKNKSKIDTSTLKKEHADRLKRLQQTYKDSTNTDDQIRNNFVGINLKKILKNPGTGEDLILEDGDVLTVPKQQQIVRVNGEVLFPSAVVYNNGKGFKGYVLNAGGFSPNALKGGAYVVYPNGTVKATSKFLFFNIHPRVKPGSEIYVPKKLEKKGLSAQELVGITTGIVSLGAIILTLIANKTL
ncbi:MAG: colonic acid export protein Wza [Mucilaginibacter sp.]|uniref:SLBB domain-containing protein n=1 Tax=Mucilaginibacter sp. TaxID=1882438 RepID=UPI0026253739|nr:SLBB domain-containing protein [Mucilaginibacter sp.]MDB5002294.1 colonic acid export protein Wza [Mucilaginibacter sp.]